ncbi:hypothetical protein J31TS4_21790 [Paenibacillus sp. J31TS4]|uniref:TFIIB-type zinc ribbon-containing protein n=1 Tax=Paenibacillus sp. J31TS4 TaxID=2807195 RepID=UPI001B11F230|nr:zf-TFIIB domain-containing protein [Paenibacillus sp. J31TS4]GIP38899.1 hypothetical protein J31TS4_21790 [Paenibacillus sp. J31TS4]
MQCPICHEVRMKEVEKDGVLIDICPSCKGVWLDRGELDKLMREVREERQTYEEFYRESGDSRPPAPPYGGSYDDRYRNPSYKHKKKKSVLDRLGDLFD